MSARGARAELFLVGGAALAVAYDATRATRDLDAVFVPSDVVRQAATAVAEREGLTAASVEVVYEKPPRDLLLFKPVLPQLSIQHHQ